MNCPKFGRICSNKCSANQKSLDFSSPNLQIRSKSGLFSPWVSLQQISRPHNRFYPLAFQLSKTWEALQVLERSQKKTPVFQPLKLGQSTAASILFWDPLSWSPSFLYCSPDSRSPLGSVDPGTPPRKKSDFPENLSNQSPITPRSNFGLWVMYRPGI